jgi:hypothetical protein
MSFAVRFARKPVAAALLLTTLYCFNISGDALAATASDDDFATR